MRSVFCGILVCLIPCATLAQDEPVAPERITVRTTSGITSWQQLPSQSLVNARKALSQGKRIRTSQMRQLADLGDGFAALRFAQLLEEGRSEIPLPDVAHYYGVAAATGRGGAITGLIRTLDQVDLNDLSVSRQQVLKDILMSYALAGNSRAIEAIRRYQMRAQPFGPLDQEIRGILENVRGEGAAQLALQLAVTILRNREAPTADLLQAQDYLVLASTSASLETKLIAQNMTPLAARMVAERPDLEAIVARINVQTPTAETIQPVSRPSNLVEVTQ